MQIAIPTIYMKYISCNFHYKNLESNDIFHKYTFHIFQIKKFDELIQYLNDHKIHHIINTTEYRFFPESKHHVFGNGRLWQMNQEEQENFEKIKEQWQIDKLMEKV